MLSYDDLTVDRVAQDIDLGVLFEREVSGVFGFLLLRCGCRAVAEDLTSQTFLAAGERFASGRGREVTAGWLRTVASRRLVDHWRSMGARSRRFDRMRALASEPAPPPADPPDDVLDALHALPDRQRAVLVLRYLEDFSISEISETLGISYKATESVLARARRSFRTAYERGAS